VCGSRGSNLGFQGGGETKGVGTGTSGARWGVDKPSRSFLGDPVFIGM